MAKIKQYSGLLLRFLISGGILGYLLHKMDWAQLGVIARTLQPGWTLAALLSFGVILALATWRWQILLGVQGIHLSFAHAGRLFFIGHFFNAFMPGINGGDLAKMYYIVNAAREQREAAALSVFVDRIIGLIALLALAVVLSVFYYPFLTQLPETRAAVWAVYLIALGTLAFGLVVAVFPRIHRAVQARGWWEKVPLHTLVEKLSAATALYAGAVRTNLLAGGISLLMHLINLASSWALIHALGLDVPLGPFASFLPIIALLIALPISFSGLGVREMLAILFFGLLGISKEHAVAFSFLQLSISLAWSLVGGLVHLRYKKPSS
jgi:glycosyltransferase 2 family protein